MVFERPKSPDGPSVESSPKGEMTDAQRAERFWGREQQADKKAAMLRNIESHVRDGRVGVLVDPSGLTEENKDMMSAYRILAGESGYEVGDYQVNPNNPSVAVAAIRRRQDLTER